MYQGIQLPEGVVLEFTDTRLMQIVVTFYKTPHCHDFRGSRPRQPTKIPVIMLTKEHNKTWPHLTKPCLVVEGKGRGYLSVQNITLKENMHHI
jgi:hypothetical protein